MYSVQITTIISIVIQFIIGIISIHGLTIKLDEKDFILREIMIMETIVQFIEMSFYIYLLNVPLHNMTATRYFDWVITTPTMLLSIIMFFKYNEVEYIRFLEFIKTNYKNITYIFLCNLIMLLFGYMGETGMMYYLYANIIGFIFFIFTFYIIYKEYALPAKQLSLYYSITFVWLLYGVAAFLEPISKNNLINILDIFAKNILGLFIYYQIIQKNKNIYEKQ